MAMKKKFFIIIYSLILNISNQLKLPIVCNIVINTDTQKSIVSIHRIIRIYFAETPIISHISFPLARNCYTNTDRNTVAKVIHISV
jgi:hypothetical protein